MKATFVRTLLCAGFFAQFMNAQDANAPVVPVITATVGSFDTDPPQLSITGSGLGAAAPMVSLDGIPLTVLSHTPTFVVCSLPSGKFFGSFLLHLTNMTVTGHPIALFDATIGATGPTGAPGPAGAPGKDGQQGPQGLQGIAGPAGPAGANGPAGPAGPAGQQGPQGLQGTVGPAGPTGANGPAGPIGANGPAGPVGAVGPAGPIGANGPAGPVGPQGPVGQNGANGAPGAQGPAGPQGPSGLVGAAYASGGVYGGNTIPGALAGSIWNQLGMKSVTVTAGQVVQWTVSAAMGTVAGAASGSLQIAACYTDASGVAHEAVSGQFIVMGVLPAGERTVVSTGGIYRFATGGTFAVGLCGYDTSTSAKWNNNDWFNLTAIIMPSTATTTEATPLASARLR